MCLEYCCMYGKQCRPWADAVFCGIWCGLHCLQRPVCPSTEGYYVIYLPIGLSENCWMSFKECRPWSDASFCSSVQIFSVNTVFSVNAFNWALWENPAEDRLIIFEPAHNKTYNESCVSSKDSDQLVHPPSMASILVYLSLDSLKGIEGTCNQQRLIRLHGCAGWSESSLFAQVLL